MTVDDIINGMQGYLSTDGEANYIALTEGTGIIGEIASAVIGVLIVIILLGLPLVIGIEVCYINFPIFQDYYERIYNRLRGKASSVFGLVVRDARMAVERSHTTENGQSANWIYLKIKCKSIFICFFIIAMVLGPGTFLIKQAFMLASGVLTALFNAI